VVDLFISYARTNRDVVQRIAEAVTALGYVVWWDEELPAHLSYGEVITQKIGEAKATLVVWSRDSAASEWVRAEADMARHQRKLIQTAIDDCTPPLPFNQIQYAALGDWTGEADHPGWRKVRASLAALCGPAPAGVGPAPVATLPPAAVYQPPRRPKSRSRASRVAVVSIAASVAILLSVGGLVLLKGPPAAQARAADAPAPAVPAAAPVAPAPTPPKADVGVPARPVDDSGEVEASDADSQPEPQDGE
jgi:hypothetical protein